MKQATVEFGMKLNISHSSWEDETSGGAVAIFVLADNSLKNSCPLALFRHIFSLANRQLESRQLNKQAE